MTRTQKTDIKMALAFGFAIVAAFFVVGVFDGLDRAIEAQERREHLSAYCQQRGSNETLCYNFRHNTDFIGVESRRGL